MAKSSSDYKVSLSGDVMIKDRQISEDLARQIINLVMGGASVPVGSAAASVTPFPGTQVINTPTGSAQTPKLFMAEKKPSSGAERITCLAYYLSKHRNVQAFKTKDISKVNIEAAQPPFSNAAVFARDAVRSGYLAKAGGGAKQIAVLGEAVVEALPDREKVKAAIESNRMHAKKPQKRRAKKVK